MDRLATNHLLITIFGMGLAVGSLGTVLDVVNVIFIGVGFGLMLRGIFGAIGKLNRRLEALEGEA